MAWLVPGASYPAVNHTHGKFCLPQGMVPGGVKGAAMSINDLPGLSVLRTKMQWHQERQRVLSENVSNSDTPNFKPRDLVQPKFDSTAAAGSVGALAVMPTANGPSSPSGAGQS